MPIELNAENFKKEVLESDKLTIADFWATWCGPCKMLSPIIDELDKEYAGKVKICKVDTDANQELSAQFQIVSIPTVIFFKDGKQVGKFVGFKSKEAIKKIIDPLL
jgi:thioredoxin 1